MAIDQADIEKVKRKIYGDKTLLDKMGRARSLDEVSAEVLKIAAELKIAVDPEELRAALQKPPSTTPAKGRELADEELEAVAGGKGGGGGGCPYCLSTNGTYCLFTS